MFGNEGKITVVDLDDAFSEVEQSWIERTQRDMLYYLYDQIEEAKLRGAAGYPIPAEVLDSDVECSVGLRERDLKGWAVAKAKDGRTYKYTFSEWHYRGSYYDVIEPPEDDYNLDVEEI